MVIAMVANLVNIPPIFRSCLRDSLFNLFICNNLQSILLISNIFSAFNESSSFRKRQNTIVR